MRFQIYPIGSLFLCGKRKVMGVGYSYYEAGGKLKLAYQVAAWPQGCRAAKNIQLLPFEEAILYKAAPGTEMSKAMTEYLGVIATLAEYQKAEEVIGYIQESQTMELKEAFQ